MSDFTEKCYDEYPTECIEDRECGKDFQKALKLLEEIEQQRDDLLAACRKGVAPFSLRQYAERFKELADKPNLAVYRVILGNAAGMFEILTSEAENREAAIAKCET